MSVIIRLQNLPLTASSIDIRTFFRGLSIPDGGVHIVGGQEGDAFIAFSTDEDARQAMQLTGHKLKDSTVRLLLSSRNEMFKVIEQARIDAGQPSSPSPVPAVPASSLTVGPPTSGLPHAQSSSAFNNNIQESNNSSRTGGLGVAYPNPNPASNFMGTHSGLGGLNFGGMSSENSYLPQNSHGIGVEGLGGTTITSFPRSLSSTSTAPSLLGTQQAPPISGNANTSNQNLFGMTAAMAGMPMPFPSIISNGGNSLPMNLNMSNMPNLNMNPAAMMGLGGMMPPGMHPPTAPPNLQGPHRMLMSNTSNGSSNMGNSHLPSQISFSHPPPGLLGNHPRPQVGVGIGSGGGGYPAGLNPMFMSGGMGGMSNGNGRMPGPHGSSMRGIGPDPNIKERQSGPVGNGSFRLGSQVRGFNDGPSRDNRDRRSRSSSRERRDISRRRNSKSRDRDRPERRRKFSRSKSRSRSPKRISGRRESRDKEEHRRRSPEKGRGRRDSDPAPTPFNTTEEEHPAVKLIGIPKDASYREIRDFLRVDIMGGGDGIVRLYEEEIAYVKLEKAVDYPRAYRSNSRKLRGSIVNMEGISIERWVNEYKLNKIRTERDIDRDRERERNKDRDERGGSDRDRDNRDRSERGSRPSRFNSASQSSCIVIRNLPPTITSRDVSSRLLKDAPVTDLIVSAGPVANGRHTAIAYIKLESSQLAQKMIDLIVRSQEGANLVVEVCNEDDFSNAKTRTSGGMNRLEQVMLRDRELKFGDTKSIFDLEPGLDDDSCSVMIERAPPNVNERDVFDFFSDIGLAPVNVKIMYDAQDACSGQIVCEFPDPHKARRATTKDGMLFGRGHVKVEMMPSGRRRNPVDPSLLSKNQMGQIRPSLLGIRPVAPGILPPRFGIPPGPNPFVQALQNVNGPRHSTPATPRGRGGPSRFGPRNEFTTSSNGRDRDDRMGGSRVRGTGISQQVELEPPAIDGPDMFGKPGCVLALENVPFKASMDDILHHLSSILNIDIAREKIIRRFDDSEKPTGDARVAFDTPAEAKLAHDRLTGTKMWNRLISYTIL